MANLTITTSTIISYLALHAGQPAKVLSLKTTISQEEWDSGKLCSDSMKSLGLRSPKLSKALAAWGVPNNIFSLVLGVKSLKRDGEKITHIETQDEAWVWDQSQGDGWQSCQVPDSKHDRREGDLEQFRAGELLFWTVGQPWRYDGVGFVARAKVRWVYLDPELNYPAGVYVDRPYGQHKLLLANIIELRQWLDEFDENLAIYMPPVWQRLDGVGNDFEEQYGGTYHRPLYCPSAESGYPDTLTHGVGPYTCFVDVSKVDTELRLSKVYKARSNWAGVWCTPLRETKLNPQRLELVSAPKVELPVQRDEKEAKLRGFAICGLWHALGLWPRQMFTDFLETTYRFAEEEGDIDVVKEDAGLGIIVLTLRHLQNHDKTWYRRTVIKFEGNGFAEAVSLPYAFNKGYMVVKFTDEQAGFMPAEPIGNTRKRRVQFDC